LLLMREPSIIIKGSGRYELVGKDEYEGMAGIVHPPPAPFCVTVTACEAAPVADTVTVAARDEEPVFCWAVTVTVPLFDPEAGLAASQLCELDTAQLVFEVTEKVPELLAAAVTVNKVGETESVTVVPPAACVTATVCAVTPVAETVTVAERVAVPVFCWAVTVTVALFEPDAGLVVSHV
jgi:hypothetical protein